MLVGKFGLQRPDITLEQSFLWQIRWTVGLVSMASLGILINIGR